MRTNRLLFRKLSFLRVRDKLQQESSVFNMFCNDYAPGFPFPDQVEDKLHGNDVNAVLSWTAFTMEDNLVLKSGQACLKSFKFQ